MIHLDGQHNPISINIYYFIQIFNGEITSFVYVTLDFTGRKSFLFVYFIETFAGDTMILEQKYVSDIL